MSDRPNIDPKKYAAMMAFSRKSKKSDDGSNGLERDIVSEQAEQTVQDLKEKHKKEIERFEALLENADTNTKKFGNHLLTTPKGLSTAVKIVLSDADITQEKFRDTLKAHQIYFSMQRRRERDRGLDIGL